MTDIAPPGLRQVTAAIAGDPQENVDFYSRVLGLRLAKRTADFDLDVPTECDDTSVLTVRDPHGLVIELVALPG